MTTATALPDLPSCEVTGALIRLGFRISGESGGRILLASPASGATCAVPNVDPVPARTIAAILAGAHIDPAAFLENV
ncbi:MAG TPA: hypothetical protein VFK32_00835 [Tepidiformaceae bacterium]|nr:hypothetical protein [Tepidiformaceae bacterium]